MTCKQTFSERKIMKETENEKPIQKKILHAGRGDVINFKDGTKVIYEMNQVQNAIKNLVILVREEAVFDRSYVRRIFQKKHRR